MQDLWWINDTRAGLLRVLGFPLPLIPLTVPNSSSLFLGCVTVQNLFTINRNKFDIIYQFKDIGRMDYKLLFIENVKQENILEGQRFSDTSVRKTKGATIERS
jgi:hypothetical protein